MANLHIKQDGDNILTQAILNGVDFSNVIASINGVGSYTPTVDCFVKLSYGTGYASTVDGYQIYGHQSNHKIEWFPVKKGQTVAFGDGNGWAVFYGIKR